MIIIDDSVDNYERYYASLLVLLALQFVLSWIPRLIITLIVRSADDGRMNTVIIGDGKAAERLMKELTEERHVVAVLSLIHI